MDFLRGVAPALATALGGPLAGAAATSIADKLGASSKTVEAVKELVAGNSLTPEQISQIKLAEIEFEKFLKQNAIDLEKIHAEDRSSARELQKATASNIPAILAVSVTIGFFGILGWMLASETPKSEALYIMLGSLGTAWTSIIAFYFGSSHGSSQKNVLPSSMNSSTSKGN